MCVCTCVCTCVYVCVRMGVCMCRSWVTGWQRPIGCLKLQVIFRKRATDYRALLRKMTCKHKASYGSSPPCITSSSIAISYGKHSHELAFEEYHQQLHIVFYGVATISRLLKIIRLFCKKALQRRLYSAKETYNFKEPTHRSHPIPIDLQLHVCMIQL